VRRGRGEEEIERRGEERKGKEKFVKGRLEGGE